MIRTVPIHRVIVGGFVMLLGWSIIFYFVGHDSAYLPSPRDLFWYWLGGASLWLCGDRP